MNKSIFIKDISLESRLSALKLELLRRSGFSFIWTTKDGENVNLEDMSLPHLKNAIKRVQNAIKVEDELNSISDLLPSSVDEIL